jgi:hypothetical protein
VPLAASVNGQFFGRPHTVGGLHVVVQSFRFQFVIILVKSPLKTL